MKASAVLTQEFDDARIYYQPEERSASPYFGTVAMADVCVEIGPQQHGTLDARLFERTEKLVKRYLELADEWNRGELQKRSPIQVEVYTQLRDLGYPKAWAGAPIEAMIHPDLLGRDFGELKKGDKLFRTFDGKDILYEGEADGRDTQIFPLYPYLYLLFREPHQQTNMGHNQQEDRRQHSHYSQVANPDKPSAYTERR